MDTDYPGTEWEAVVKKLTSLEAKRAQLEKSYIGLYFPDWDESRDGLKTQRESSAVT